MHECNGGLGEGLASGEGWVQLSRAIARLLQVAIDQGRYATARKPQHRLERTALSKHDLVRVGVGLGLGLGLGFG